MVEMDLYQRSGRGVRVPSQYHSRLKPVYLSRLKDCSVCCWWLAAVLCYGGYRLCLPGTAAWPISR